MIAELIRHALAEHSESRDDAVLAGTLTLIYRAESGRVRHALANIQSAYVKEVISSQHVLLEDDQSLEVLLVQGPAPRLHSLCDGLRKVRGVQQIKLVTTTALLPPLHSHGAEETAPRGSCRCGAHDEHGRSARRPGPCPGHGQHAGRGHAHPAGPPQPPRRHCFGKQPWAPVAMPARSCGAGHGCSCRTCKEMPASPCSFSTPTARSSA